MFHISPNKKTMKTPLHSPSTPRNQKSNLLIGLIFGLIIGLAIALAVAFYIKQAPKPFVNDPGIEHKNHYLHDNLTADINRTLAGTQPALPAPPANERKTIPQTTSPSDELEEPQILEVTNDEINEIWGNKKKIAHSKKEGITKVESTTFNPIHRDETNIKVDYFLQIGAFKKKEDAEKQRAEIAFKGLAVNVIDDHTSDEFYRVRLGPFNRKDLRLQRERLEQEQIEYIVIRSSKKL